MYKVEEVLGRAYRALIITTVRTSLAESMFDKEAGFLTNAKVRSVVHTSVT